MDTMEICNIPVGIVICNWNKKDYVLKCIESVKQLNYKNYDITVVDNASTDGSVEAIEAKYPDITLIKNTENKGGSGGFNTGIKYMIEKGKYKYIYLLDNDVILDKNALYELVKAMELDNDLGIAGSKIYVMDTSNQIQELGAWIDWNKGYILPNKKGYIEKDEIIQNVEVDYVPACSLLVRTEAIQKAGIMDQKYFLYWDDIEWGYRIKSNGYKVKAISNSKVWHKMGVANKTSTLTTYYFWRNRIHFFNKYAPEEKWKGIMSIIFEDYFTGLYTSTFYGKKQTARSMYEAIKDGVNGRRGKAKENQYGLVCTPRITLNDVIKSKHQIVILDNEYSNLIKTMIKNKFPDLNYSSINDHTTKEKVIFIPCSHVFDYKDDIKYEEVESYWVDRYLNVLPNNNFGKKAVSRFQNKRQKFMTDQLEILLEKLRQQRMEKE